jgi:hypothetical protein
MGQRLNYKAWNYLKEEFPEEMKSLTQVNFSTSRSNLVFLNRRFRKVKKNKKIEKTNSELFGIDLGCFFDWMDDNSSSQYYVNIDNKTRQDNAVIVQLYFFEETDAVGFKLVFGEKDLTFIPT